MTNPTTASSAEYLAPVNTQTWVNGRHKRSLCKSYSRIMGREYVLFYGAAAVMFFFKPGQLSR